MADPPPPRARAPRQGESRWPMALAVVVVGFLHAALPRDFTAVATWPYSVILGIFLVVLVVGDPGRIDQDKRWLRITNDLLIAYITFSNAIAIGRLINGILHNASFSDAPELMRIGVIAWLINVIAFALWYWDLDAGGAAARAAGKTNRTRAFAFPETELPENADGSWYPQFFDYLTVSFYTATAFSPTDVSAVKRWAKLMMMAESFLSLTVALLVFARAINIWPTAGS